MTEFSSEPSPEPSKPTRQRRTPPSDQSATSPEIINLDLDKKKFVMEKKGAYSGSRSKEEMGPPAPVGSAYILPLRKGKRPESEQPDED